MPDEEVQELGREGVGMVKAWLESTTWMDLPSNAYEDGPRCKVVHLAGSKKFDLRGHFLGAADERRELTVESKRYNSTGKQLSEFKTFLAIAYSATVKNIEERGTWRDDFIWVTFHPFAQTQWTDLTSEEMIKSVLQEDENARYLAGRDIDEQIVRQVASSVWVLVLSEKQLEVALTTDELNKVMTVLERRGNALWQH